MFSFLPLCVCEKKTYVFPGNNLDVGTSLIPRITSAAERSSVNVAPAFGTMLTAVMILRIVNDDVP